MAHSVSEYRKNKFGYFFDFFDLTGRGYVTIADFVESKVDSKQVENCKGQADEPCRKDKLTWWELFVDHAKRNGGKILRGAFIKINVDYHVEDGSDECTKNYYKTLFDYMNENNNGRISPDEFIAYYKAHNWKNTNHIRELFHQIDRNQNGFITRDQFVDAAMSF